MLASRAAAAVGVAEEERRNPSVSLYHFVIALIEDQVNRVSFVRGIVKRARARKREQKLAMAGVLTLLRLTRLPMQRRNGWQTHPRAR